MFAGVWDVWKHNGREWHTYSILTTRANMEMENIHDRMPVILRKADWQQWLEADRREDIEPLLAPYKDGGLDFFPVSKEVNIVRANSDTLILPINSK